MSPALFLYTGADALCRVVDRIGDYKILQTSKDYVVRNTKGVYDNHGHFYGLDICYTIIDLMQKQTVPKSKYLRGSALRISTNDKYIDKVNRKIAKDKNKQKFVRINKGI